MSPLKTGFPPLVADDPRFLVLGSLPGDASIACQEYYGHPTNRFWRVLAAVFGEETPVGYPAKKRFLARHRIALWDVCAAARREGSLDANIQDETYNDLAAFLQAHPGIRAIALNGGAAARAFGRYCRRSPDSFRERIAGMKVHRFASTSAAAASWSFERLCGQWRALAEPEGR